MNSSSFFPSLLSFLCLPLLLIPTSSFAEKEYSDVKYHYVNSTPVAALIGLGLEARVWSYKVKDKDSSNKPKKKHGFSLSFMASPWSFGFKPISVGTQKYLPKERNLDKPSVLRVKNTKLTLGGKGTIDMDCLFIYDDRLEYNAPDKFGATNKNGEGEGIISEDTFYDVRLFDKGTPNAHYSYDFKKHGLIGRAVQYLTQNGLFELFAKGIGCIGLFGGANYKDIVTIGTMAIPQDPNLIYEASSNENTL